MVVEVPRPERQRSRVEEDLGTRARAAEKVGVDGSDIEFDAMIHKRIGGKSITLALTGTALREKFFFNVYAIGSYVQKGTKVKTPEGLAAVDVHKRLHLILERDVSSADMAAAIKASITANYPEPQFATERRVLEQYIAANPVKRGEHVWLTHVPGVGLSWKIADKKEILIKNPKFSKAVWDIYFGPKNIGVAIKRNLSSRL